MRLVKNPWLWGSALWVLGLRTALGATPSDLPPGAVDKKPAPEASAKAPAGGEKNDDAGAPPAAGVRVERTVGGQKLFRITESMVVEGQRQKPNAFYVLQRASAPYDWEALEESFLPRILKAIEKPPF